MSDFSSVMDERKEAIEAHDKSLGGTDVAAVVGLNPYKNALDVYLGKLGLSEPKDVNEFMYWGNYMEEGIRQAYERRTGWKVQRPLEFAKTYSNWTVWGNNQVMLHHPTVGCVSGSPDGLVLDAERGLEIKTAGYRSADWGRPGSDEIPTWYLLQVATYMAITGLPRWDVGVLFSGNNFQIYTVTRNLELEAQILEAAQRFWSQHVEPKVPPPIDGSESCSRYLAKKYLIGNQTFIEATEEAAEIANNLRDAQLDVMVYGEQQSLAKNLLADFIGENKGCHLPDGSRVQWVRPKPTEVVNYEGYSAYLETLVQDFFRGDDWRKVKASQFTEQKPGTPYIRLFEPTANQKKLKGPTA